MQEVYRFDLINFKNLVYEDLFSLSIRRKVRWVVKQDDFSEIWGDREDFKCTAFCESSWVGQLGIVKIQIGICHHKFVMILILALF